MANYLLCHKEFKSLGMSYIELADINIDKITIQDGSKRLDRTDFLKYGCSKERQYQENVSCVKLICNISILKDDIGYYFNYIGSCSNRWWRLRVYLLTTTRKEKITKTSLKTDRYIKTYSIWRSYSKSFKCARST